MKLSHPAAVSIALATLLALPAHAAIIVTNTTQIDTGFTVSNTDLLQTNLGSAVYSGNFQREGEVGVAALTDGVYGGQGNQGNGGHAATADGSNSALYNFDSGNGAGYNISSITSYSGWDAYRGGQSYNVSYASIADPLTFTFLAHVFNNANGTANTNTRAEITESNGFLATNVVSLRFDFGGDLQYGYAGYRQIDVVGTVVPEPASVALLGLGFAGLVAVRRRKRAI